MFMEFKTTISDNEQVIWEDSTQSLEIEKIEPSFNLKQVMLQTTLKRIQIEANTKSEWRDSWKDGGRHVQSWGKGS